MAKPRSLPDDFYQHDFKLLAKKETHPRTKIRFMALHSIQQGKTYQAVAETFLVNINAIYQWLRRYKEMGIEGLQEKPRSGRKSLASEVDTDELVTKIIALQDHKKGGRIRLKDIDTMIKKVFNIHYKDLNGVHYLVTRLGLSWISSRSRHPKQDQEKQDEYKKTSNKAS